MRARLKYQLLVLGLTVFVIHTEAASRGFKMESIMLYQPENILRQRLPDAKKLPDYIARLESVCATFFSGATTPETLQIVVAVRPGKRSRVWLVSSRSSVDAQHQALRQKLEAVTPCEVRRAPVAFALTTKIAGGDSKELKETMPREWQDAAKGRPSLSIPDGILDVVWPNR